MLEHFRLRSAGNVAPIRSRLSLTLERLNAVSRCLGGRSIWEDLKMALHGGEVAVLRPLPGLLFGSPRLKRGDTPLDLCRAGIVAKAVRSVEVPERLPI
jgi:hypothetical protein